MKANTECIVQTHLLRRKMARKKCNTLLIGLICLSIVVRLIFVICFLDHNRYYWKDANDYTSAAESLISSGKFGNLANSLTPKPYGREPVYPILIASLLFVIPHSYLVIRIIQSIIITASSLLFYKVTRMFVDRKLAVFGTFLYLFYPFYVHFGGLVLPEPIYLPGLLLYVYLLLMYVRRHKTKYLYLAVALLAVLGHLKMTSWSMGLVLVLSFFLVNKVFDKTTISRAGICCAIFLIICLPWGIRNYITYGKVTLPRNRSRVGGKDTELALEFGKRFSVTKNVYYLFVPKLTRVVSVNEFNRPFYHYVSIAAVTPLLIATAVLLFFKRDRLVLFLYLVFFSYCLPYLLLQGQTRYRLPIDFIMILFFVILFSLCPWFARKDGQSACRYIV